MASSCGLSFNLHSLRGESPRLFCGIFGTAEAVPFQSRSGSRLIEFGAYDLQSEAGPWLLLPFPPEGDAAEDAGLVGDDLYVFSGVEGDFFCVATADGMRAWRAFRFRW